ncbi:MAG: PfkB domain protein [Chloroflexi bacterium]|nr:PfkB domain protein [Chloroflexota bacterium]
MVVGSASRDLSVTDRRGWRLGGAAAYIGLTLARLGLRPRVLVGVDSAAAEAAELDLLRDAGADLRLVLLREAPVFDNREVDGLRTQHCIEPGNPIQPASLPPDWRSATTWIFGPVADEVPEAWAAVPPADAFVALGWQGLLRDLPRGGVVRRRAPAASALVRRAGLVGVSRHDLGPEQPIAGLIELLRSDARLVVTDGKSGGTSWTRRTDGSAVGRRYPAIPARVVDPTGAGDAFLAGLVAARLGHQLAGSGRAGPALRLGAALGSLVVEGHGLQGVPLAALIADRLRVNVNLQRRSPPGAGSAR